MNAKDKEVPPKNENFIIEPDMDTVLSQLIPKLAHLMHCSARQRCL